METEEEQEDEEEEELDTETEEEEEEEEDVGALKADTSINDSMLGGESWLLRR